MKHSVLFLNHCVSFVDSQKLEPMYREFEKTIQTRYREEFASRLKAARKLGMEEVPCIVQDLSEEDAKRMEEIRLGKETK